jgi:nucleotide-binding universal stress UspA family protein
LNYNVRNGGKIQEQPLTGGFFVIQPRKLFKNGGEQEAKKMFEKILLPLDGSVLAETALPYLRDLESRLRSEVYLLHICPPEHQAYLHMHQIYLNSIADSLRKEILEDRRPDGELKVQSEVIIGEPAAAILDYIKQKGIDLVALTTFGSSGIRGWAMGSVADKIVRGVEIPSLLVRVKKQPEMVQRRGLIQKILVPLDSSDSSKTSIPYAVQLAKKLQASITLFSMSLTAYAQSLGGVGGIGVNLDKVDAATESYTEDFLLEIEKYIREAGVDVNHTSYLGMDAAFEILEMEKKIQADLVVMASRGRSPIARWAFGSVAEKVLQGGDRPILVVRKKEG